MASKTSSSLRASAGAAGCGPGLSPDGVDDPIRRAVAPPPVKLIFKRELMQRTGLTFPTIWRMMREGRFPRAHVIGGKSAWIESEINDFLAALPLRRYKGDVRPGPEGKEKNGS